MLTHRVRFAFFGLCLLLSDFFSPLAWADRGSYATLIDDAFPSADEPFSLKAEEFRWLGIEELPAGSRLDWESNSVEWSRIADRIVLPRARVRIEIPGVDSASVEIWGRTTPLRRSTRGSFFGDFLVPLVSGDASQIKVFSVLKNKSLLESKLSLEKISQESHPPLVADGSCSPYALEIREITSSSRPISIFVDCRLIRGASSEGQLASLDLLFVMDGANDGVRVNGVMTRPEEPSIFRLRLPPQQNSISLEQKERKIEIRYKIPHQVNRGFLGVGAGPYQYRFLSPGVDVSQTVGILTLYGSYQLSETVRFTAFNATAIHKNYFTDTGFYLKSDSFKLLDQKVQVFFMLGANIIGFKTQEGYKSKWGAPQGFEAAYRNFLKPNYSLVLGAFIYPPIDGKSYYNTWVRYGSPQFFGELNYIAIKDQIDEIPVSTRSIGLSFGMPLARFF